LLSKLTTEERERLGGVLIEAKFADGQTVFDQGTAGDGFYIIKEGNAVVTHSHQDTRSVVTYLTSFVPLSIHSFIHSFDVINSQMNELARLSPGDYFGETGVLLFLLRRSDIVQWHSLATATLIALLTNAPRGASVSAVGPLTCWFLSKAKFKGAHSPLM
jgi:CRP-like cAMP-binding protein